MTFERLSWPGRTRRLTIRPLEIGDLHPFFAYRSLAEVCEWEPRWPRDYDEWLMGVDADTLLERTLTLWHDDELVGDLYLRLHDPFTQVEVAEQAAGTQAELGWTVAPAHQRQGYATEAAAWLVETCFAELGLRRVVAETFADNEPSWRLMERLGMRREQHAVADALHRERGWLDSYTYALLREEWGASRV